MLSNSSFLFPSNIQVFDLCAILSHQIRGTALFYVYDGKSTKNDWNHKAFSHEISKKVFEYGKKNPLMSILWSMQRLVLQKMISQVKNRALPQFFSRGTLFLNNARVLNNKGWVLGDKPYRKIFHHLRFSFSYFSQILEHHYISIFPIYAYN